MPLTLWVSWCLLRLLASQYTIESHLIYFLKDTANLECGTISAKGIRTTTATQMSTFKNIESLILLFECLQYPGPLRSECLWCTGWEFHWSDQLLPFSWTTLWFTRVIKFINCTEILSLNQWDDDGAGGRFYSAVSTAARIFPRLLRLKQFTNRFQSTAVIEWQSARPKWKQKPNGLAFLAPDDEERLLSDCYRSSRSLRAWFGWWSLWSM